MTEAQESRQIEPDPQRVHGHVIRITSQREGELTSELAHALAAADMLVTESSTQAKTISQLQQMVSDRDGEIEALRARLGDINDSEDEHH